MLRVGKDIKAHLAPTPCCELAATHRVRLPRANLASTTSRDGALTVSLGSLFQYFTTLCAKNFFLISNINILKIRELTPTHMWSKMEGHSISKLFKGEIILHL